MIHPFLVVNGLCGTLVEVVFPHPKSILEDRSNNYSLRLSLFYASVVLVECAASSFFSRLCLLLSMTIADILRSDSLGLDQH